MHFNQVEFGCRLKQARKECGFTQEQLAEKLNITPEHMGRLELGRRGVSIDLLIDMSNILHVSLDYLIKGTVHDPFRMKRMIKQIHNIVDQIEELPENQT